VRRLKAPRVLPGPCYFLIIESNFRMGFEALLQQIALTLLGLSAILGHDR